MLLVKTYLGMSMIHGNGIFASEEIPEGTVIWKMVSGFDLVFSEDEYEKLPNITRLWMRTYSYFNKSEGGYILCADDGRFMNHSLQNNTSDRKDHTIANRLIKKGEELTCNYYEFDEKAFEKLGQNR